MRSRNARRLLAATVGALATVALGTPALAGHVHYVVTPNGACHQVASGQTSIDDVDHGGYHRYHDNVHVGATGPAGDTNDLLGHGKARVAVYKAMDAPAVCFGD
jgi:hypothetical protein